MFDPAVVGPEAVVSAPQHRLGAVGDTDLAVGRADVGLDGVDADEHQLGEFGVGLALGDQGEDLGFTVGQTFDPSRPVAARMTRDLGGGSLITIWPAWIASNAATSSWAGSILDR